MTKSTEPRHFKVSSPLIEHYLLLMRDRTCPHSLFRQYLGQVTRYLAHEAMRSMTLRVREETVIAYPSDPDSDEREETASGRLIVSDDIVLVPIMRAGLVMSAELHNIFPLAPMGHIGIKRDRHHGPDGPIEVYFEELPADISEKAVIILDPVIATGTTALEAIGRVERVKKNLERVYFLSIIGAPAGLEALAEYAPQVTVFYCAVDTRMNESGHLLPGFGDAGDRLYSTTRSSYWESH